MTIFNDPALKLEKIGAILTKSSAEISASPLSIGFECLDRKLFNPDLCYDRAAELGVKWARCQTAWNRSEPEKGKYDFAWLDNVVDQMLKRKIQPWLSFVYGNPLYMENIPHPSAVGCIPTAFGTECLTAWKNYIEATVRHFKTRVKYYEIWNEPNVCGFWYPLKVDGASYAELVKTSAESVSEQDTEAKIVVCMSKIQASFVQDALKHGMGDYIDIICTHPYGIIPEDNYVYRVRHLQALLAKYAPSVKVWQGECGYPAQAHGHKDDTWLILYNANETTQAKYVIRRIFLDRLLGMELSSYFHLADLIENPYRLADGQAMRFTLLGLLKGHDYQPKRAFHAMRHMAPIFDAECNPEPLDFEIILKNYDPQLEGTFPLLGLQRGSFLCKGYPLYAYYFAEDLQREWFGRSDVSLGTLDETEPGITNPILIDPLTSNVYRPLAIKRMQNGETTYEGLPLTDYPLLLTDRHAIDLV
ncbi:MAG: beta-galactosidase [Victivallales bacterium]|nr:beta-galactosidase [Victivallales bacterium]